MARFVSKTQQNYAFDKTQSKDYNLIVIMKSIFVYNPESGKGKIKKYKNYILRKLKEKYEEVDCVETTHPLHASELARESIGKYDYFFICGGDGTLGEVINGMGDAENKPIIGYIPCGTVNDVASSLGISKNIKKATDTLVNGMPLAHDIFKVNNHYGIYVCCAGLFTKASYQTKREAKKHFGKLPYFIDGVKDIFKSRPLHVKISNSDSTIEQDCALMLILNSRSVAGFKLNKNAELSDGAVDVILFNTSSDKIHLNSIFECVKAFVFGIDRVKKDKKVTVFKANDIKVDIFGASNINIDGEKVADKTFEFSTIKNGVKILVPKSRQKLSQDTSSTDEPEPEA